MNERLDRDEFELLPHDEQVAYVAALVAKFESLVEAWSDTGAVLECSNHLVDVYRWFLPPDDFERVVCRPAWNHQWEHAEETLTHFEGWLVNPELTEGHREDAAWWIRRLRPLVEYKAWLNALPDVGGEAPT